MFNTIPIVPSIPGVRERLDALDETTATTELVAILRATQELMKIRGRLLDYIVSLGSWPDRN